MSDTSRKGQQPEALRSLEAAAEAGGKKPPEQGMTATSRTAPERASLEEQERTAAEILKEGAERATGKTTGETAQIEARPCRHDNPEQISLSGSEAERS
jgi:hypothetical protein